MGKKSRRAKPKTGQKGGGIARAPAAAAGSPAAAGTPTSQHDTPADVHSSDAPAAQPSPAPPGAACWICLDGDPDDDGKPIVRDCSCRGDDAGFAHISCLVNYAHKKTRELEEANAGGYNEPWTVCPNCRREYQRHVAIDMAKALLSYLEENYPGNGLVKLYALSVIMNAVVGQFPFRELPDLREEGRRAADEIVSVVEESGASDENSTGHLMVAYTCLAKFAEAEKTKDGYETALCYYAKARDHSISVGDEEAAYGIEGVIEKVKSKRDGGKEEPFTEQQLKNMRAYYEKYARENGADNYDSIANGINLIHALHHSGEHGLELERLSSKLTTISRRVNGPDHQLTKKVEEGLAHSRTRRIAQVKRNDVLEFHVLRLSDDGGKYVVKRARSPDRGKMEEIALGDDYVIVPGTPVVCHGLKSAAHLNGKLGDVRFFDDDSGRYAVRFENKRLKTVLVKPANLRIVFELPDEPQG